MVIPPIPLPPFNPPALPTKKPCSRNFVEQGLCVERVKTGFYLAVVVTFIPHGEHDSQDSGEEGEHFPLKNSFRDR